MQKKILWLLVPLLFLISYPLQEASAATATKTKTTTSQTKNEVPLKSISFNKKSLDLLINQSESLKVSWNPTNTTVKKNITWTSSNNKVATVDKNGKVSAKATGNAKITATVAGKQATLAVSVKTMPLKSIKLSATNLTLIQQGKQGRLNVYYNPTNTTVNRSVKWTSSNYKVATVNAQGVITAKKPGTVFITASVNGKKASAKVTVKENLQSKVFVTKTGDRYHYDKNCHGLNNSKSTRQTTLKEAKNKRLTLCKFE